MAKLTCWLALLVAWCGSAHAAEQIAVRGGTLVNVRTGQLIENAVVVIDADEVVSVTQGGPVPAGATVLDATGKYLIPGLIDLHVHYKDWSAELYLNHGVTTVISLGDTHEWIRAQKQGIEEGLIPGPRLFISTENLDKPPTDLNNYFVRPYVRLVEGPEEARSAMRDYLATGVQAVKVYDGLTVEQLRAIAAEAEKGNIPVIGHFKDVRISADVGVHGIEHVRAVANAIIDEQARITDMRSVRPGLAMPAESFIDAQLIAGIVRLMVDKGLYLNPTLRINWHGHRALREKGFHYEDFELTFNDWRLRYVPLSFKLANLKEYQEIGLWNWRDLSQHELDVFHRGYVNSQRIIKAFVGAGGKLYAGTDSANMAVPGLSLHQELELLVDAGVSPLAALQAATINSAMLMRMSDRLGTVESGKAGDLVILDANPLEHIRNTRKIWRVISRGRVLDGEYHPDFKNPLPMSSWEDSSHYFPSPRIQSVTPKAVESGNQNVVMTVTGTGFIPYSLAQFDGVTVKTEWVSTTHLRAHVPSELLQPGTYALTVQNPDFAGGTIFARGGSDIAHLGIRDHVSNSFLVLVTFVGAVSPGGDPKELF